MLCDNCIHCEVCGLEDHHEEAMTYCRYREKNEGFVNVEALKERLAEYEHAPFKVYDALRILNEVAEE